MSTKLGFLKLSHHKMFEIRYDTMKSLYIYMKSSLCDVFVYKSHVDIFFCMLRIVCSL